MTITISTRALAARCACMMVGFACFGMPAAIAHAAASDSNPGSIEEITVNAQKRDARLTDTPVAVSVVGESWIARSNLTALEDLADVVPNLTIFSDFLYNSTVTMRGVGSYSRNVGFDERVGLYLDGIYLGPSYAINQNLLDIAQVEVLRGPQGTFFGRNAIAGAINLKSQRPGDELVVKGRARLGTHDALTLQGLVAVPVDDVWAISLSAGLQKRDGQVENTLTGHGLGGEDRKALRAQVRFSPNDRFEAFLSLDRNELDERALIGDPLSDAFGATPDSFAPAYGEVAFNTDPAQSLTAQGAGLDLRWTFASGTSLQSLTGLRETKAAMRNDTDYSPVDLFLVDYAEDYDHLSQEIRFASATGERLTYVLGVTYLDIRGATDRHGVAGAEGYLVGMAESADVTNTGRVDTTAWGLFANADYAVSSQLSVSAGVRWSRDKKRLDWMIDTTGAPAFALATGQLQQSRVDEDISPTVSLSYALDDGVTAFVRYAEGYKSGGYNLDYVSAAVFPNGVEFGKESARSYEAGVKGVAFDGEVWFSLAAFWVDYSDFQVNQFRDLGQGQTALVIANAASVRTRGLEAELRIQPLPGLDVRLWGAMLDARYREFTDGGVGGSDVSGNRMDAPRFEAGFAADYMRPVSGRMDVFVHVSFSHADGYYVTPDNIKAQPLLAGGTVPYGYLGARDMLSAKLGLSHGDGWRLALYGENLLDDRSVSSSLRDFFGTISEVRREGRAFGVELTVDFR
ncbi:TonB-dependent receptor [Kordiimonas aestuarii]|uniref:TonB-dependent receptor n=1 Tax=Kordiimonas aestuarii TaxID=1005925 RepID=UPI0021CFFDBB|nr:TonB-dependent receptor [Kordiimonas aestuarii]